MGETIEDAKVIEGQAITLGLDLDKIKTIKDIKMIMKSLQMVVQTDENGMLGEQFREIYEAGFLVQAKE